MLKLLFSWDHLRPFCIAKFLNPSTKERQEMADSTFIGNWNLFMASTDGEGVITVRNATVAVTAGTEGYVNFRTSNEANFGLRVSENSGYVVASGSSGNFFPQNMLLVVVSQDGKTFYGAFKPEANGLPQTWWGVKQ
jgi:hypothetical protein